MGSKRSSLKKNASNSERREDVSIARKRDIPPEDVSQNPEMAKADLPETKDKIEAVLLSEK